MVDCNEVDQSEEETEKSDEEYETVQRIRRSNDFWKTLNNLKIKKMRQGYQKQPIREIHCDQQKTFTRNKLTDFFNCT